MVAFRIRQDNQTVVKVEGPDEAASVASIMHYAMLCRQDGEVTIQHNAEGHWKRWALMCQWPLPKK